MDRSGTIRDIRTGRALARTNNLNDAFVDYACSLIDAGKEIYVVSGNCRALEVRDLVDGLRAAGLTVIRDRQFPPDTFWLFEGTPEELGFAS